MAITESSKINLGLVTTLVLVLLAAPFAYGCMASAVGWHREDIKMLKAADLQIVTILQRLEVLERATKNP